MDGPLVALLGFLGVAATAGVTWLVARRQRSGKIDTSEASTLWAEGQKMREELREEAVILRREVLAMRDEAIVMRSETVALREEAIELRLETAKTRAEMIALREEAHTCHQEMAQLREWIEKEKNGG